MLEMNVLAAPVHFFCPFPPYFWTKKLMKMQEETGPIWPQAKEHQGMLVAYRIERHTVDSPLECLGNTFVLDFRTPEL